MKVSELVAKLLEVDQDLDVGRSDSDYPEFESIEKVEVGPRKLLEFYKVEHDSGETFPGWRRSEEAVMVVTLT